ncbi:MAG: hypothetical protein MJ184_03130 [Treponema sp.]|uniref:tetratricopeptide repeat protein n=1 Tax=Treponema sp. TaxID=166 RepID=UPI00298D75DC|nr:hypothetical protein [Treponema sp.]MCQ2600334.1 hypothetical protein [Treponema sp.]
MKKTLALLTFFMTCSLFFAQSSRPVVSEINAIPKSNKTIKLTWKAPQNSSPEITGFLIFRDIKPITSSEQLSTLKPLKKLDSETFTYIDTLRDSREYYFCIICTTTNGTYNVILPSVNTTVNGTRVASVNTQNEEVITPPSASNKKIPGLEPDASEKMRDIPLPTPGLIEVTKNKQNILGPKAMEQAKQLGSKYTGTSNKITKLFVFENDLICPEGGDDYYLFKILKSSFVKKNFKASIDELTDFLSIHRSPEVTNRATFYLGESYYFAKEYEKAVFQFLAVQEQFPELSKKWIDSSLDMITVKD